MAVTETGAALTEQHRLAQLALASRAIRDFSRLWPLWTGDEASFQQLLLATVTLVRSTHRLSASVASSYYSAFRFAEGLPGPGTPVLAPELREPEILRSLYVTGRGMTADAIAAGARAETAMQTALVRTSGTVTRLTLQGGRDTLILSTARDPDAGGGWMRVTDGNPCVFCRLLAGRGPVYSADTADFQAHDHCGCTVEPHYPGADWPGRSREFRAEYDQAVADARAAGELRRGTSNDLLNAYRRFLTRT